MTTSTSDHRQRLRRVGVFVILLLVAYIATEFIFKDAEASSNYAIITVVLLALYFSRLMSIEPTTALIVFPVFFALAFVTNWTQIFPFPKLRYDNPIHLIVLSLANAALLSAPIVVNYAVGLIFRPRIS